MESACAMPVLFLYVVCLSCFECGMSVLVCMWYVCFVSIAINNKGTSQEVHIIYIYIIHSSKINENITRYTKCHNEHNIKTLQCILKGQAQNLNIES